MDLAELQREMARERARIEMEMGIFDGPVNLRRPVKPRVNRATRNAKAAKAENNAIAASKLAAAASATKAAAASATNSRKIRKRSPGANAEIAGNPAHLKPGAPLQPVEGRIIHKRNLASTRGRRTKTKKVIR